MMSNYEEKWSAPPSARGDSNQRRSAGEGDEELSLEPYSEESGPPAPDYGPLSRALPRTMGGEAIGTVACGFTVDPDVERFDYESPAPGRE